MTERIALPFDVSSQSANNVYLSYINTLLEASQGYTGKGIKVAVLDTGANSSHPMLVGKIVGEHNFTSGDIEDSAVGHGTWVCSCIAGNTVTLNGKTFGGIAPESSLLVVKVLDDEGSGQFSTIIEGIHWAVTNGANIINMSLGAPYDDEGLSPLSQTIDWARSQGVIVCVAAGNSNTTGAPSPNTPGTARKAITVGSINTKDVVSYFSSRGGASKYPYPTICAYGGDIANGNYNYDEGIIGAFKDGYSSLRGTSMSTPEIAALCAILMQKTGSADLTESMLIKGAIDISDVGVDNNSGYGKANLKKALGVKKNTESIKSNYMSILYPAAIIAAAYALYRYFHK